MYLGKYFPTIQTANHIILITSLCGWIVPYLLLMDGFYLTLLSFLVLFQQQQTSLSA